ncbi:MAG: HmuY family protein [Pseudomonadota bacterium]
MIFVKPDTTGFARLVLPLMMSSMLIACGGGSSSNSDSDEDGDTGDESGFTERTIDATSFTDFAYFNLDTGETVDLSTADAAASTDWHISLRRTALALNGGDAGPGVVTGAIADSQDDFYNSDGSPNVSVFTNASPDSELNAINDVTDFSSLTFTTDTFATNIIGDGTSDSWWLYESSSFSVLPNPDVWNLIRGANGDSYAKFNVTAIDQPNRGITLDLYIQGVADAGFATTATQWTAAIGAAGGQLCYDIDTALEVDCTTAAATWDLLVEVTADGRGWNIWTNGGVYGEGTSGVSFGPLDQAGADSFVQGNPTDTFIAWGADATSSVFDDWYAYNLQSQRRLWSNYRVYAIDTGDAQYKLQILSYYDPTTGTSGNYTIRYTELE